MAAGAERPRDTPPGGNAAALRLFRRLRAGYTEGRAALPAGCWRAWRGLLLVAVPAMFGLMVALRVAAERLLNAGYLDWEPAFLQALIFERPPFGFSTAVFFVTFGSDITLAFVLLATIAAALLLRRPITAWSLALAFVVPDLVGRFGWLIWARARPTLLHEGFASPGYHSFPSGHTSKTIAVYGLLAFLWVRASGSAVEKTVAVALAGIVMVVVPLGRMAMGVHWPSDILGGAVIGLVWLAVLTRALRHERARDASWGATAPGPP